jgi:hypothetical protein
MGNCETCEFMRMRTELLPGTTQPECRNRAPVRGPDGRAAWPIVDLGDGCAEWVDANPFRGGV